jgi:hypothetical protein
VPRVVVNDAIAPRHGDLSVSVNNENTTFRLRAGGVDKDTVYGLPPRTLDLLLIAAAVFEADARVVRGGATRSEFGANWRRAFHFVVPVADAAFWRSEQTALAEMLGFLTGDGYAFEFVARGYSAPRQASLLGFTAPLAKADDVILFSGGLDSLAGAVEALATTDRRIALVTHRSAQKVWPFQKSLREAVSARLPDRVGWGVAFGRLRKPDAAEMTQRSRSFLYGACGFAAAVLTRAERIRFCENGVVSVNLPISRQVIGTMATRTTHPLYLRRLAALLGRVADRPIHVDNPYAWLTKTEVVERLATYGGADLIAASRSCSNVWRRSRRHPHCGCCSQCLDRRFAVLAAGAEAQDPAERYEVDLFLGEREKERDRTMAHDWTRHAVHRLATVSLPEFSQRFAAELGDVVSAYPDRPA